MNSKEALQAIKQLIDMSIKGGVFNSLESVATISQAFNIISKEINNKEVQNVQN